MFITKIADSKKSHKNYFYENNFNNLDFKSEKINKKQFIKCKFKDTIFSKTVFDNVEFWRVDFNKVFFVNCKFLSSVFYDIIFKDVKFINCEFKNSFFGHCEIQTEIFKNCEYKNLKFNTLLIHQKSGLNLNVEKKNLKNLYFYYNKKFFKPKKFFSNINLSNIKKNKLEEINILENSNHNFLRHNLNTNSINIKNNDLTKLFRYKKKFNKVHDELIFGKGYLVIKDPFKIRDITTARKIIDNYKFKKTFDRLDKRSNQFYLHNLFNVNKIFEKLLPQNRKLELLKEILGQGMQCGFYSANILKPGARGQHFHIDHPYPIIDTIEGKLNGDFVNNPLNLQSLLYLNDSTIMNGATSFVPYSQNLNLNPSKVKISINEKINKIYFKYKNKLHSMDYVNFEFKQNTMVIFNGLAWHRGGFNYSKNQNRTALNAQWIPSYVKPMHNFKINKIHKRKIFPYINQNYPIKL
jgi:ectoine hydroxylase-related dioxygenase (phytanoyl-CoA dioxygenase family)/uncharacterized protein YjbI with pentapeptide repeats